MNEKKVPENINDFVGDNIKALASLFPSAVKDGQLDIVALKEELGQFEEVDKEKYDLTWAGKQEAKKKAQEEVFGRTLKYIPEDSKNPETTENLYIEGDNLEALKLLRQNYYGSIKMIYIDPPYNTGNDLVYNDKFIMETNESDIAEGLRDDYGAKLQKNAKSTNRFHANWINSIYPTIKISKDLLTSEGVIFISIDDNEIHNLRKICDEIFGEEQFVECITWNKRIPKNDKGIGNIHEYILIYTKNNQIRHEFIMRKEGIDEIKDLIEDLKSNNTPLVEAEKAIKELYKQEGYERGITLYNSLDKDYRLWGKINMSWPNGNTMGPRYNVMHPITKKPVKIPDRGWRWKQETFDEAVDYENIEICADGTYLCGRIWFGKDENMQPSSVNYLDNLEDMLLRSIISLKSNGGMEVEEIFGSKNYFSYPKPTELIKQLIYSVNDKNAVVLDFFSGSATTAHAVMKINAEDQGNRKFIMVQLPEPLDENSEAYKEGYKTICDIGKERIRRAGEIVEFDIQKYNLELKNDKQYKNVPDTGFKVFQISDTNIKWNLIDSEGQIDIDAITHNPDLADFTLGFNDIDVVYEIMLRQKDIPLSEKLELKSDIGERTYLYGSAYLICLETDITESLIDHLAGLNPLPIKFVFRDSAFKDDINLKDDTLRRLKNLIERNSGTNKSTYTVEFI